MTTKKRSKPRVLWLVLDCVNKCSSVDKSKSEAMSWKSSIEKYYPEGGPYEVVKYVREVKRK